MSGCDLFYHVSIYRIVMRYRKIYIDHKANVRNVTGPPGALLFGVKPEIALKESLELQF